MICFGGGFDEKTLNKKGGGTNPERQTKSEWASGRISSVWALSLTVWGESDLVCLSAGLVPPCSGSDIPIDDTAAVVFTREEAVRRGWC